MTYRLRVGFFILVGMVIIGRHVDAQVTSAKLRGTIRNGSGAVVPGAKIIASNTDSGLRTDVVTNEQGLFLLPGLPPGEFTVTVEAKGFLTVVYSKVALEINQILEINLSLQAGDAAAGPITKSATELTAFPGSQIATTYSRDSIDVLPQLARVPITLGVFQPGIEIEGGDEGISRTNGTRQGSNNLRLDSMDVNDPVSPSLGLSQAAINTDSIAQFRVITAGAKAEYGRNAGAQVLLVTRSGGSHWAGSVYDYLQNAAANANDFFNNALNAKRPQSNQNMFGFSLGGPLIANRTAIFGNYEGNRFNREIVRNRMVLSAGAKAGVFKYLPRVPDANYDLLTYDIVKNDPRKLGIAPQVAQVLNLLPDPNNGNIGDGINTAGYQFNNPINGRNDQFTIRIDHRLTSNNRVFYRQSWSQSDQVDWRHNADATFPGQASGREKGKQWGFSLGSDWALAPSLLNEFRFGRQSASSSLLRPARLSAPMMISGLWTDPLNPDFPSASGSRLYEIADNATYFRGKHSWKAGANVRFTSQNLSSSAGTYPDVTFGTSFGNAPPATIGPGSTALTADAQQTFALLYNALLGRMEQVSRTFNSDLSSFQATGTPRARDYNFREYGVFLQDDWRLRKDLTLSLGVRYEISGAPSESNRLQGALDQASSLVGQSYQIANFALQPGSAWYKTDWNNAGPRFGFAWNPSFDRTLTVRGGYGMFYDRLAGAATSFVDANTPGFIQNVPIFPNQSSGDIRISDGIPLPVQPGSPTLIQPVTRSTSAAVFDPRLKTGYIQELNLTLQKKLSHTIFIEASYVGTRGIGLFMNQNLNQVKTSGDFLRSFSEIQAFRTSLTPVPTSNSLVRLFGSVDGAVKAIGGATFDQGLVGVAAETVDRTYYGRYSAAGLSDYYLRNYPQFNQLIVGTDHGRSYYDSFQLRAHRQAGGLNVNAAYTWSKSLDTISVDPGSYESPIDSFHVSLNKGRSDADRPHVVNAALTYTLPLLGKSPLGEPPDWLANLAHGWNIGMLAVWESGLPFTASSGRQTATAGVDSWANYSGSHKLGSVIRDSNGIYYFYGEERQTFTFPAAGEIGTSGRNSFRGPSYFDFDMSLSKDFQVSDKLKLSFRLEAYNVFNNTNFGLPMADLSSPNTFGKISSTVGNPRTMQMALRFSF